MSSSETIQVRCPRCQTRLNLPASSRGTVITCPQPACGKKFSLKAAAPAETAVPPVAALAPPVAAVVPTSPLSLAAIPRRWAFIGGGAAAAIVLIGLLILARGRSPSTGDASGDAPTEAATGLSEPAGKSSLPAAYVQLARIISDSYSVDPTKPATGETVTGESLETLMGELAKSREPSVKAAAEKVLAACENAVKEKARVQGGVDDADRAFAGVIGGAMRGNYVERRTRIREVRNADGTVSQVEEVFETDESFMPILGAAVLNGFVRSKATGAMRSRVAMAMEEGRLGAWADLMEHAADYYPRSPERAHLVTARSTGPENPSFTLVNTGGRTLTDVTLALESVHFQTTPESASLQVLFVPRWPANAPLYLNTALVRNLPSPKYGRPTICIPNYKNGTDRFLMDRMDDNEPWLAGAGGVIEARIAVRAAEAHQPMEATKLPDGVAQSARFELDKAYGLAVSSVMRDVRREARVGGDTLPTNKPKSATAARRDAAAKGNTRGTPTPLLVPANIKHAVNEHVEWPPRAARRVLSFVPADSDLAKEAQALLDDETEYVRRRRQREVDGFTQTFRPGSRFVGEWAYELGPGFGIGTTDRVRDILTAKKGSKGRFALEIESHDAESHAVTGRLFDPDRPQAARPVIGAIQESEGHYLALVLCEPTTHRGGRKVFRPPLHPPPEWLREPTAAAGLGVG